MSDLTQQAPPGVPPAHPFPEASYAAQVLTLTADELVRVGRSRIVTQVSLRRAFTVAVAARLHQLPTVVADETAAKAWAAIPPNPEGNTHSEQAGILRAIARSV